MPKIAYFRRSYSDVLKVPFDSLSFVLHHQKNIKMYVKYLFILSIVVIAPSKLIFEGFVSCVTVLVGYAMDCIFCSAAFILLHLSNLVFPPLPLMTQCRRLPLDYG